ncbi:hypothetical protein FB451DRAFT_1174894 [Mycena latifolia]|nr:hypothetical protein FB451DRAFT_1174894 [Mycena latifolia]
MAAGRRLKGVSPLRVRQARPLELQLNVEGFRPLVAASGWMGIRQLEPEPREYDLEEALATDPEMRVYNWQGAPTPILDGNHHVMAVLGGNPRDADWITKVARPAAVHMEAAAAEIYSESRWHRRAGIPWRGPHGAKSAGPSMGAGQTCPMNLAHSVVNMGADLISLSAFHGLRPHSSRLLRPHARCAFRLGQDAPRQQASFAKLLPPYLSLLSRGLGSAPPRPHELLAGGHQDVSNVAVDRIPMYERDT